MVFLVSAIRNRWALSGVVLLVALAIAWALLPTPRAFLQLLAASAILTLPGLALTYLSFPYRSRINGDGEDRRALDSIERATFAILFSIVIVSLVVFVLARAVHLRPDTPILTPRMLFSAIAAVTVLRWCGAIVRLRPRAIPYAIAFAIATVGVFTIHWVGTPVTRAMLAADAGFTMLLLGFAAVVTRAWTMFTQRFPALVPFGRYAVIGAGNTVLDFTIYTALTRGFPFWGRHYLLANAFSFLIVVTWSFYWNKRWAFGNRERRHVAQYMKFISATVVSLGIAEGVLATGVAFGLPDLFAKALAAPLVVVWNYCMYRSWAFRSPRRLPIARSYIRS
ncbi:GtrA family protein [Candidatus Uhrbacteria bacterium]|nr:GtrA family protein [Candidatus Uhrbacteria bacterium]